MPLDPLFGIMTLGSLVAFGLIATLYLWPWLRSFPEPEALRILLLPHAFRLIGLSFLETGVVSPDVPSAFAMSAAYGDAGAALLAMAAILALTARASWAIALVWVFNLGGMADLFFAFYHAFASGLVPSSLGATFFLPTVMVPLFLVTHVMMFGILVSRLHLKPSNLASLDHG